MVHRILNLFVAQWPLFPFILNYQRSISIWKRGNSTKHPHNIIRSTNYLTFPIKNWSIKTSYKSITPVGTLFITHTFPTFPWAPALIDILDKNYSRLLANGWVKRWRSLPSAWMVCYKSSCQFRASYLPISTKRANLNLHCHENALWPTGLAGIHGPWGVVSLSQFHALIAEAVYMSGCLIWILHDL